MGTCCTKQKQSDQSLHFTTEHHPQVQLSTNRKQAFWKSSASDVTGYCISNRFVRSHERVKLTLNGSGYVDVGLISMNPFSGDYTSFKYIFGQVLYFNPCVIEFELQGPLVEIIENGVVKDEKINVGSEDHWLMIKLGCGEIQVNLQDD